MDGPNWRVSGSPVVSGEFSLTLEYRYALTILTHWCARVLPFVVNPDPKTLWKDLDSDRNAPFWKRRHRARLGNGQMREDRRRRRRGRSAPPAQGHVLR